MTGLGSYDISHVALDSAVELRRLNAQVELFWPQELALYRRVGLKDGMQLLDCGCGTGYVLQKLCALYPALQCTGVEYDAKMVAVAKATIGDKNPNCKVMQQSIMALDLPDDSFDFVISRLVLEHLPDPMLGLKEVLRVLKTGGKAVFVDNDFDLHERTWPDSSALGELYDAYRRARRSEGGNPCIGRQLPVLLRKAGFGAIDLQVLVAHNQIVGDNMFLKAEGAGIPAQLVRTGYLAAASLQRITGQWSEMLKSADHAIFRMLMAGIGEKTGEPTPPETNSGTKSLVMSNAAAAASPSREAAIFSSPPTLNEVRRFIQQVVAQEINVQPDSIAANESLIRAGIDSMAAMALCGKLESSLSVTLNVADVLCDDSIDQLGQKILALVKPGAPESTRIRRQPRQAQVPVV